MTDIRICKLLYDYEDSQVKNGEFHSHGVRFGTFRQKISLNVDGIHNRYYSDSLHPFDVYDEDYNKSESEMIKYLEENNLFEILSKELKEIAKSNYDNFSKHCINDLTELIDNFLSRNINEMRFDFVKGYNYILFKKVSEGISIRIYEQHDYDYEIIFKDSKTPAHAKYYIEKDLIYDFDIDIYNFKILFNFYRKLDYFFRYGIPDNDEIKTYANNLKEFEEEILSSNEEVCRQREELKKMRDFRNLLNK